MDAERAHQLGTRALDLAAPLLARRAEPDPACAVEALGLRFPSPLVLAAGFDKNAEHLDGLLGLGFGGVEVGTVTAQPQPGNPKPRLFRLLDDEALINRMGFNNDGAEVVAARLAHWRAHGRRRTGVVGVNIGKTKVVDVADAPADYQRSAELLAPHADYLVVNVSSPNTPGLRELQAVSELRPILEAVMHSLAVVGRQTLPLLVKIAPDLADEDVDAVADLTMELGLAGLIATNTTTSRGGLRSPQALVDAVGAGGLSGRPLRARSLEVLDRLHTRLGDRASVISVGGVADASDVRDRLQRGAALVQAYSGFVYGGPGWPGNVARTIASPDPGQTISHALDGVAER